MGRSSTLPILVTHYRRYLEDADSARFIKSTSRRYRLATLERLAEYGTREARRAAVLGLGLLADFRSNAVLGRRLHDADRAVRLLAEDAIREVWCRDGNTQQRHQLHAIMRWNGCGQYGQAILAASQLIGDAPWFAEAWNQRAVAYFHSNSFRASANDCQQTLELNPYHYGAAVGMGQCYLDLEDGWAALECFRRALKLNPALEGVRSQITHLQRALEERLE